MRRELLSEGFPGSSAQLRITGNMVASVHKINRASRVGVRGPFPGKGRTRTKE